MDNNKTLKESVPYASNTSQKNKEFARRRDKSDLGDNFVAPDGGWGWLVCIAAGISNLSVYPCLQQFGFIFRERLHLLGFASSEITAIINTNSAISACTGLLNGPMFRRFTFRQVAIMGSVLVFCGVLLTAFCDTFMCYIVCEALLYGFGMGISMSASTLAINTYFKKKRHKAAGWSWTITGLGPIVLPYFATYLVITYGVQGTVLIFAAFSLHTMVSALIYQPVRYHTSKQKPEEMKINDLQHCSTDKNNAIDDLNSMELRDPGTPILSTAKVGWCGSKESLNANKTLQQRIESCKSLDNSVHFDEKKELKENFEEVVINGKGQLISSKMTCLQKVIAFFDLDLLKDITFINLVTGLTVINFAELNFAILLPFILNEFGLTTPQVTICMSTLAGVDIIVRFLGPFFTGKISWDNRVFFLIGVTGISLGRTVIACWHTYPYIVICFAIMGIFKGIRTIYWPLIIPSCVPLKRLPAAFGLQLLISGLFTLAGGPFVGLVRDRFNYAVTLHILNILSFVAAFFWVLEAVVRRCSDQRVSNNVANGVSIR